MDKTKILRYVVVGLIIVIFAVSFINHIVVNMRCETMMKRVSDDVHDIRNSMVVMRNDSTLLADEVKVMPDSVDVKQVLSDLDSKHNGIKETIDEMHKQASFLFDANTITFLVSFALALLFTALLSMQDKVTQQMKAINDTKSDILKFKDESKRLMDKVINDTESNLSSFRDETKRSVDIVVQEAQRQHDFQRMHISVCQIYNGMITLINSLVMGNNIVSNDMMPLIYLMDREVKSLLKVNSSNQSAIELLDKRELIELLYDCINNLNVDKLKNVPENKDRLKSIRTLNEDLISLRDLIESMPELSVKDVKES